VVEALILEDDEASLSSLSGWLESKGVSCRACETLEEAREAIAERLPDLAVLDLELPDGSGLDMLRELSASRGVWVVMASGKTTVDAAIDSLRLGADDFLQKPIELPRLEAILKKVARAKTLQSEVETLRTELRRMGRFGDLIGESPAMHAVYDAIERVAPTGETVLLTGPTGSGKELAARTIHRLSPRAGAPFVAINCGAISPTLIESEFFGHERGAFTGADRRRQGVFEQAHRGTLLLDEITEMPLDLQVKLLRVLETSCLSRLGGSKEIEVDVRILAATNRDPYEAVAEDLLREDLLYRLLVFPIELPPLTERGPDVVLLARTFLERMNEEHETNKAFGERVEEALMRHDWPGNVRELYNVVRRAHVMAQAHIEVEHLPFARGSVSRQAISRARGSSGARLEAGMSIAEAEQKLIEATLEHLDGNKKQAAKMLGISLKTLYARIKVYAAARSEEA